MYLNHGFNWECLCRERKWTFVAAGGSLKPVSDLEPPWFCLPLGSPHSTRLSNPDRSRKDNKNQARDMFWEYKDDYFYIKVYKLSNVFLFEAINI